jgi:threonine dehydrogenase-like Zn-dependent dehydrogenase
MRAVVYTRPGQVIVDDVAEPRLQEPADVIVRVLTSAICGTDLHALHGLEGIPPGTVLGHEFVGEVVAAGNAVRSVGVGDVVSGSDFTACGLCWWCRRGDHWECPERSFFGYGSVFGKPLAGAQAELVRVPYADTVVCRVPDGCPPDAAIFVGDTLATGYAAADRAGVAAGDTVLIVGGGAIGQMTSLACQAVGAASVVLVDLVPGRRELAAMHGAIASSPEGAREILGQLTDGRGADAAVDAVGGPIALRLACDLVRPRGVVVSVGAHFDATFAYPVARAFAAELTLTFAIGDAIRDRNRLFPLVTSGVIDPTVVVTSRVPIDSVPEAYQRFSRHEELKILIVER